MKISASTGFLVGIVVSGLAGWAEINLERESYKAVTSSLLTMMKDQTNEIESLKDDVKWLRDDNQWLTDFAEKQAQFQTAGHCTTDEECSSFCPPPADDPACDGGPQATYKGKGPSWLAKKIKK